MFPLSALGLSPRVIGLLNRNGITDAVQLAHTPRKTLRAIRGLGRSSMTEITNYLGDAGFLLDPDPSVTLIVGRFTVANEHSRTPMALYVDAGVAVVWDKALELGLDPMGPYDTRLAIEMPDDVHTVYAARRDALMKSGLSKGYDNWLCFRRIARDTIPVEPLLPLLAQQQEP